MPYSDHWGWSACGSFAVLSLWEAYELTNFFWPNHPVLVQSPTDFSKAEDKQNFVLSANSGVPLVLSSVNSFTGSEPETVSKCICLVCLC